MLYRIRSDRSARSAETNRRQKPSQRIWVFVCPDRRCPCRRLPDDRGRECGGTPRPIRTRARRAWSATGIESQDIASMVDKMVRHMLANPTLAKCGPSPPGNRGRSLFREPEFPEAQQEHPYRPACDAASDRCGRILFVNREFAHGREGTHSQAGGQDRCRHDRPDAGGRGCRLSAQRPLDAAPRAEHKNA